MAAYYLDTSTLVKGYVSEIGSTWVTALIDPAAKHDLYTVRLTGPEMIAALHRKARTGQITMADASFAATNFFDDWLKRYQILEVSVWTSDRAMTLAMKYPLRGYDAVHLAAALEASRVYQAHQLPPLTFVSADLG
jgi:predicted nucleic acid-binding protein